MKYEFHAQFPLALQDSVLQASAISFLAGERQVSPQHWQELAQVPDDFARLILLAQAIATGRKDEARVGSGRNAGGLRFWLAQRSKTFLNQRLKMMQSLQMFPFPPDLAALPIGSWFLQFTFTLRKPYLSQDDADFYIIDNPVKKEWVFKLPYIAPTQWKGALRHALWQLRHKEENEQIRRLFGTANDDQLEEGSRGRLYFYPTFFNRLSLEVINPHDRQTGAGSQPIYFEAVPSGTSGVFTLLYTPLDRIGQDEAETRRQVAADLQLVAQGLQAMFTTYGFGAKTSSGFGLADDMVGKSALVLKWTGGTLPRSFKQLDELVKICSHIVLNTANSEDKI